MIGIDVSIVINDGSTYLTVPVIPKQLSYSDGSTTPVTVDILGLGAVDFDNGVELDSLSYSSFFPARYDPYYCATSDLKTPIDYRNQFSTWKDNGTKLQVVIPAAGINKSMQVSSFKWDFKGFEGDLYYSVIFKEKKTIVPVQVAAEVAKLEPAPARDPLPVNVEIQKGDKVRFKGGPVYVSSNATSAAANRKEAECNCTLTYNGTHPYHLIYYSGDMVYGWVDAANCEKL